MIFKTVGRIIRWSGEYKKRLFAGCLFSFFSSFTIISPTMLAAWAFGKVVECWREGRSLDSAYVWLSIIGIVFFILIRFWFSYMRACLQESIGYEKAARERITIGETLKKVSLGYFTRVPSGEILTGLTTQLTTLELQGLKIIDTVLNGYIQLAAVVLFLLFLSPATALVAVLGTLVSYLTLSAVNWRTRRTYWMAHKAEEDMAGSIIEFIHGLPIIKSFGSESGGMKNYRQACRDLKDVRIRIELGFIPWNTLHLLVLKLSSVWIIALCSGQALRGEMDIAMYLMFMMFSFTIFAGAENVNDAAYLLAAVDAAMDKLDSLAEEEEIDRDGKDVELDRFDVELQHVSFGYEADRQILSDVSLTIPQGTVTAIVGPSGSGKTTLCNLIARFYDVTEGSISVGGVDIRRLTCDSLLKHISMVFQNVYLFEDTIRSNIRFGRPDASDAQVEEAARAARCHDFIMQLPQGYDTVIGEGGSTLSGGERQRISIARAILKQAPIVILDEATASIDPENEHLIQEAISALTEGKTIITIAHRLSTIEQADQIIVLEEGRVSQRGTHAQLMQQDGLYRKFVNIREKTENWAI